MHNAYHICHFCLKKATRVWDAHDRIIRNYITREGPRVDNKKKKNIRKERKRDTYELNGTRLLSRAQPRIYLETTACVNCIMQISIVPAESSARGKRSIKIHGRRRWVAELSRVSATTVSSNCIFRWALQPGSPRREYPTSNGPRHLLASVPRVFSPGNKVLSSPSDGVRTRRAGECHFSRCTPLFSVAVWRSVAGEMHLFMFRLFAFIALQGALSRKP